MALKHVAPPTLPALPPNPQDRINSGVPVRTAVQVTKTRPMDKAYRLYGNAVADCAPDMKGEKNDVRDQ